MFTSKKMLLHRTKVNGFRLCRIQNHAPSINKHSHPARHETIDPEKVR